MNKEEKKYHAYCTKCNCRYDIITDKIITIANWKCSACGTMNDIGEAAKNINPKEKEKELKYYIIAYTAIIMDSLSPKYEASMIQLASNPETVKDALVSFLLSGDGFLEIMDLKVVYTLEISKENFDNFKNSLKEGYDTWWSLTTRG